MDKLVRFFIGFMLVLASCALQATPPARTIILGQANISYQNAANETLNFTSNIATFPIAALVQVELDNGVFQPVIAGNRVQIPHVLTNNGNDNATVTVTGLAANDSTLPLSDLVIYWDTNENGVIDAVDIPLTGSVELSPDQSINLIIDNQIPLTKGSGQSVVDGDQLKYNLEVRDANSNSLLSRITDTLEVAENSVIFASADDIQGCNIDIVKDSEIDLDITLQNIGFNSPIARNWTVDSNNQSGLLLHMPIPAGTVLSAIRRDFGIAVVQKDDQSWISLSNWNGTDPLIAAGVFAQPSDLPPSSTHTLGFSLAVSNINLLQETSQLTVSFDANGDSQSEVISDIGCLDTQPQPNFPSASIRFITPVDREATEIVWNDIAAFTDVEELMLSEEPVWSLLIEGVYIELSALQMNLDDEVQETVDVTLTSQASTEQLTVKLYETGVNSGLFRSITAIELGSADNMTGSNCPVQVSLPPAYGNTTSEGCYLTSALADTLTAQFVDAEQSIDINALAPVREIYSVSQHLTGTVFDSISGEPLAGVVVEAYLGDQPIAEVTTDSEGVYLFDQLPAGNVSIQRAELEGFEFPSEIAQSDIYQSFDLVAASWGLDGFLRREPGLGIISLALTGEPITLNLPMDKQLPGERIVVEKTASVSEAEIGDRVKYTVNVKNVGNQILTEVKVRDTLPFGYKYEPGTAKINGDKVPVEAVTPLLTLGIDEMQSGDSVEVTYIAKLTAGAVDSDGINRVYAENYETRSGVANARVKLSQRGLLSDKAIIFGKLFIDSGCDYVQNDKEWPVPGVRLYFEDGTYVITDENGQYSLYGVDPGLHVIKIDKTTLPAHIEPYPYSTRFAADPHSRFADVAPGDFHRADFVFSCPKAEYRQELYETLKRRNENINSDWLLEEAMRFRASGAEASFSAPEQAGSDGDISSGTIGKTSVVKDSFDTVSPKQEAVVVAPEAKKAAENLTKADGRLGRWLWPEGDITLDGRLMYAVRTGIEPELYVNGEKMDKSLLGEVAMYPKEKLQVQSWYRLPFIQGDNTVVVKAMDPFGNERTLLKQKVLYQPGSGDSIEITAEKDRLDADRGRSVLPIEIDIRDVKGRPARGLEFVTLETTAGTFAEEDVQPDVPGHQVRVLNGNTTVNLRSSTYTGDVKVAARWQKRVSSIEVRFEEPLRPMIAVGFIDISTQASVLNGGDVQPADQADGFNKTFSAEGKTSFFLKGKIKGDMLLTMAYNNKKTEDTELFRDIDPNAYYPIYGDASIKGYDAQSRSKLYVKLEKSKNSILWGDFKTDNEPELNNSLGRVNESLTGATGTYDDDMFKVTGYGAQVGRLSQTVELRGNGTATFYELPNAPILPNSENVEIIIRDRDNPGLVISQTPLVRFQDYTLDDYSGHLRFFEPINYEDENGNPIYIRVEFQSEQKVDEHIVAGVRATIDIDEQWQVGASVSHDGEETEGYDIATTHVKYELGEKHLVTAEVARMEHKDNDQEGGNAAMVELRNDWSDSVKSRVVVARAEPGFNNPAAAISEGRQEVKADLDYRITDQTQLTFDALQSEDLAADNSRLAAGVDVKQTIGDWAITGGTRYIQQNNTADDAAFQTGRFRVDRGYKMFGRNGTVYAELEQDLSNTERRQWAVGSDYQVHDNLTAYIRHETIDSFSGVTSLSTGQKRSDTQLGFKSDVLPGTDLYSETRLRGGIDGRELNAVNGVRSRFEIEKDFAITPSVEIVNVFEGDDAGEGWAVSVGMTDYRSKNDKKAMRIETRQSKSSNYYAFDGTYAARLTEEWTTLYMDNFYLDERKGADNLLSNVLTLGAAVRPRVTNVWNALFFYQFKYEENITEELRRAHILSNHHNILFDYDFNLATRFAMKFQDQTIDDQVFNAQVYLLGGRLIKAIDWRWDIDVRIAALSSDVDEDLRYSFGVGAHYLVAKNLRAGLSYNFVGFQEKDLDAQEYHAQGIRLGLQFKFDEELFKWLQ